MGWYWRHTEVNFQSPWKLSDYALVVYAENLPQAINKMNDASEDWPSDFMRLSDEPSEPQGPCDSERSARAAAAKSYQAKKQRQEVLP